MKNIHNPVMPVRFKDLALVSSFKVKCPACKHGVLALRRCTDTMMLQETVCCTLCCQHCTIMDIEEIRADDFPSVNAKGIKEEKQH